MTPDTSPAAARAGSGTTPAWHRAVRWYYLTFLCGICYRVPLLVGVLLPLGLLTGLLGGEYGPPLLLLHEDWQRATAVGVAFGLFWVEVLFVDYLLWLRDVREGRLSPAAVRPPGAETPRLPQSFVAHAAGVFAAAVLTCVVVALLVWLFGEIVSILGGSGQLPAWPNYPAAGVIGFPAGAGAVVLVLWLAHRRRDGGTGSAAPTAPKGVADRLGAAAVVLVGAGWAAVGVIAFLALYWSPSVGGWAGAAAAAAGLAVTAAFGRGGRWALWPAVGANALLAYTGVTWCVSNCPLGVVVGAPVAAGWTAVLLLALGRVNPEAAAAWRRAAGRAGGRGGADPGPGDERLERDLLLDGLRWGAAGAILLGLAAFVPWLTSPALPPVLALIAGYAVYGLFAYLVRRSVVPVVLVLVVAALIAQVQRYKMRFVYPGPHPGLPYYDRAGLLPLDSCAKADTRSQLEFNKLADGYRSVADRIADGRDRLRVVDEAIAFSMANAPQAVTGWESHRDETAAELRRDEADRLARLGKLKDEWGRMNREHRVVPPRVPPGYSIPELRPETPALAPIQEVAIWEGQESAQGPGWARRGNRGLKTKLIVVAVSGGGLRAAVWTYHVLAELELAFARRGLDFPSHVRLVTGASGGMLGAGYYVTTLAHPRDRPTGADREAHLRQQLDWLESDFLTPITRRLVLSDLPGLLSPWVTRYDRGKALEAAWRQTLRPADGRGQALGTPFAELRAGEKEGWRPSLVFTPMIVEDGRRLVVSNLDLRYPICNDGMVLGDGPGQVPGVFSVDALELFRLFPEAAGTFEVGMAARMSASFPYFSPGVSLPTTPRRRVVDAGYYDNYGVGLSAAWLFSGSNREWLDQNVEQVLLVQIRTGVISAQRQLREVPRGGPGPLGRAAEEASTPLEGLLSARVSSASFRNDSSLELLSDYFRWRRAAAGKAPAERWLDRHSEFAVETFELGHEVSLSWYLTRSEIASILSEGIEDQVRRVVDFCASPTSRYD